MSRFQITCLCLIASLVCAIQYFRAYAQLGRLLPSPDEQALLLSGFDLIQNSQHTYRVNPPLGKLIAAGAICEEVPSTPKKTTGPAFRDEFMRAHQFTLQYSYIIRKKLAAIRTPFLLLSFACVIAIILSPWARAIHPSVVTALVVIWVGDPFILSQGCLAATDIASAFATVMAITLGDKARTTGSLPWSVATAIVLSFGVLMKYTSLVVLPVLLVFWAGQFREKERSTSRLGKVALSGLVIMLVPIGALHVAMGAIDENYAPASDSLGLTGPHALCLRVMRDYCIFPSPMVDGLAIQAEHFKTPKPLLLGDQVYGIRPIWYLPALAVMRLSLPVVIVVSLGLLTAVREIVSRRSPLRFHDAVGTLTVSLLIIAHLNALADPLFRYLLPAILILFLKGGAMLTGIRGKVVAVVLLLIQLSMMTWAPLYPSSVSYICHKLYPVAGALGQSELDTAAAPLVDIDMEWPHVHYFGPGAGIATKLNPNVTGITLRELQCRLADFESGDARMILLVDYSYLRSIAPALAEEVRQRGTGTGPAHTKLFVRRGFRRGRRGSSRPCGVSSRGCAFCSGAVSGAPG